MKQDKLYWLAGALVALLGLAYFSGAFDEATSTVNVPTVDIPADDLDQVRIESPDQTFSLQQHESRWQLTTPLEAEADSATAARLIEQIGGLTLESVVSINPERYARYGVDTTGTRVTASWPGGEHSLVIGSQGPDFQSTYVRLGDDPRVFLTRGRLDVPASLDRWRDKRMIDLPQSQVDAVTIVRPGDTFSLKRSTEGWQIAGQQAAAADSAKIARWLGRFAPARADGFFDDKQAGAVRSEAPYRIVFNTTTGDTYTMWFEQAGEDAYALTTSIGDAVYRIASYRFDALLPKAEALRAQP